MKTNQSGFSILPLLILTVVIAIIGALGVYIHKSNKPTQIAAKPANPDTGFRLVEVDTSNWHSYSPHTNFTFKYPTDWSLEDTGQFKQRADGNPNALNPSYVTIQMIHLASGDATVELLNGNTQDMSSDTIKSGAGIDLMITFDKNTTTEDLCGYYIHKKVDYFTTNLGKICQVQLQKNYYAFMLGKNGNVYRTELFFKNSESKQNKEKFISVARELVKNYSFSN